MKNIEKRICPNCNKPAYSSSFVQDWVCPNCEKEIPQKPNCGEVEECSLFEHCEGCPANMTLTCNSPASSVKQSRKDVTKMLKKLMKFIRRQLLKIDWFKREVDAYLLEQKIWARILRGGSVKL